MVTARSLLLIGDQVALLNVRLPALLAPVTVLFRQSHHLPTQKIQPLSEAGAMYPHLLLRAVLDSLLPLLIIRTLQLYIRFGVFLIPLELRRQALK